jgi:hypothetical protein
VRLLIALGICASVLALWIGANTQQRITRVERRVTCEKGHERECRQLLSDLLRHASPQQKRQIQKIIGGGGGNRGSSSPGRPSRPPSGGPDTPPLIHSPVPLPVCIKPLIC